MLKSLMICELLMCIIELRIIELRWSSEVYRNNVMSSIFVPLALAVHAFSDNQVVLKFS